MAGVYGQTTAADAGLPVHSCMKAQLAAKGITTLSIPVAAQSPEGTAQVAAEKSAPNCAPAAACNPKDCCPKAGDPASCKPADCKPADCDPAKCTESGSKASAANASDVKNQCSTAKAG